MVRYGKISGMKEATKNAPEDWKTLVLSDLQAAIAVTRHAGGSWESGNQISS